MPCHAGGPTGEASGSCHRGAIRPGTGSRASSTPAQTFATRKDATAYLAKVRADLGRSAWIDPNAGKVPLSDYTWRQLAERPNLRPRTRELYVSELKRHILPGLGSIEIGSLTTSRLRTWHAWMLNAGQPGATTVAKCYRRLRAIRAPQWTTA